MRLDKRTISKMMKGMKGGMPGMMGGQQQDGPERFHKTPGQEKVGQGKKSSPFKLKGFQGKMKDPAFVDPAGPMKGNPLEQPGSADPYEAGSGEQRQKPAQADPKQVEKLKGEKKKRADLALPTGAIPAKDKKAGTAVSRRLQRGGY